MRFTKMHGIGNDYIYVNCFEELVEDPAALAIAMSKYHFGVGSDGLVLICPSDEADFSMRMFKSDGSESEMCGNATRCIGKYVYDKGLTDKTSVSLMTGAGLKLLELKVDNGKVRSVRVDMGAPELAPELIPTTLGDEVAMGVPLDVAGSTYAAHCVSMGNPHCVVFVEDPLAIDLPVIGPMFEHHAAFPKRTNTEFVQVISRNHLKMRVWERGSGETLACGTGACASLVAAVMTGQAERKVTMDLLGGSLELEWSEADNHVYQEGPATFVFEGEWLA